MANNAATAVMTRRSQGSDCTFKAVEGMCLSTHDYLKGLIIFIATSFTVGHPVPPCWLGEIYAGIVTSTFLSLIHIDILSKIVSSIG
jgi:hypothetical protein